MNPDFISANNGVFICQKCMGVHYQFTDEVSLIIKNNLFLLNEEQINYIYFGGNRKLLEFITYDFPLLQNIKPEIMYKTQAMQFYRDNLYFLVEGGEKPIKPNDNIAYKLIDDVPDMLNYPLTEKREKNYFGEGGGYGGGEENNFNNYNNNILEQEEEMYHLDDENINNININMNNSVNNNTENIDNINNCDNIIVPIYSKNKKNNSFVYNNNSISTKIPESENANIFSNNNSKDNFYQKKDKFFNEMNRLFGTDNINNNINNKDIIKKKNISTKTYKVKRPKFNFNYNNYIKNTININNNNTNIFFEEDDFNKNIFSKSQMISLENNPKKNKQINKTTNQNNNKQQYLYNNSQIIEPILKKGKINISKKVFIKPKLKAKVKINKNKNDKGGFVYKYQ